MDIQDMRIFARVAAVQNLSAVGSELGLTPGTISKRIQALEDELSARLFDRTTRSIRITRGRRDVLSHVERILSEIEMAAASVDDRVTKPKGKLKILAPPVSAAATSRRRSASSCGVSRHRGRGRYRRSPGQPAGGRLRHRHPHRHAVDSSLIAKRLAPDRHIIVAGAGLSRP
jgi:hypothetical protein